MLEKHGKVTAIEIDDEARQYASQISGINVLSGWLPDGLFNINQNGYDVICLFDVLEHVQDDSTALNNLKNYLKYNDGGSIGKLIITVPAYQWLYGHHDKNLSHFRRYSKSELCSKLLDNGYKIKYAGYINTFLFPLMLLGRLFDKLSISRDSGTSTPPHWANELLARVFSFEKTLIPKHVMPFGGSVMVICEANKL